MGNVQKASYALGSDMSAGADPSQEESSLQSASASLQSDSQTAQANLPPVCVPRLRSDESVALNDASKAAIDCENAVSEIGSGNYTVATGDFDAAAKAIEASGGKFNTASLAIEAFNNS